MTRQLTNPILIDEEGVHQPLVRLPFGDSRYDESWLQKLLFEHDSLLPIEDFEPAFADHVAVCRELPTPAGHADLLYMNPNGFMTLVETKLWRNPDARRSVIAQIIDYTKEMARWTYEDLAVAVRRANESEAGDPFVPLFEDYEDFEQARFVDSVSRNLRLGRFLLLIVGDGIREGVEHMVEYLQETPQLHFTLGLVEIGLYRVDGDKSSPLLVQPRILARTKEIVRAVVEVRSSVQPDDIRISIPIQPESETATGRKSLTEDLFFEELNKTGDAKAVALARWVLDNAESYGLEIMWGDAGPLIKWVDEQTGDSFTFGQLTKDGKLGYTVRLWGRCRKWGLPFKIAQDYFDSIVELVPGAVRRTIHSPKVGNREMVVMGKHGKPGDGPPLAVLADHKERWFDRILETVDQLRETLSEKA